MSTKIYHAYRVKPAADVWTVLRDIEQRGRENVSRKLDACYRKLIDELDTDDAPYRKLREQHPSGSEIFLRANLVHDHVREGAKKSATNLERSTYDLDVSVALLHHETGYYLRAFCDGFSMLGGSLDFLDAHPDLEDFHFQNQADPPKNVSDEAWDERGRIWGEMMDQSGCFPGQLILEISNYGLLWRLSPWLKIVQQYHDKPWAFPTREEVAARSFRELPSVETVTVARTSISCLTKTGAKLTISKCRKPSQKGQWASKVDGVLKRHRTLARAVGRVYTALLDPETRRRLERWMKRAKQERQKKRLPPA